MKIDWAAFKEKRVDYTEDSVITVKDRWLDLAWWVPHSAWHTYEWLHGVVMDGLVIAWGCVGVTKREPAKFMARGTAAIIVIAAIGSLL